MLSMVLCICYGVILTMFIIGTTSFNPNIPLHNHISWITRHRVMSNVVRLPSKTPSLESDQTRNANDARKAFESDRVTRIAPREGRKTLDCFAVGQKVTGRIIAVVKHGIFVDIGAVVDGLVHVKDISKNYFISNFENIYLPGHRIDAYIKFADPTSRKLGLQLFPVDDSDRGSDGVPASLSLSDLKETDKVTGKVVKLSTYGVYVDIGLKYPAYLHKRKMKLGKKRLNWMPWQIHPLHSEVTAYICSLDLGEKFRIGLTTFHPADWDVMLPADREQSSSGRDQDFSRYNKIPEDKQIEIPNTAARRSVGDSSFLLDRFQGMSAKEIRKKGIGKKNVQKLLDDATSVDGPDTWFNESPGNDAASDSFQRDEIAAEVEMRELVDNLKKVDCVGGPHSAIGRQDRVRVESLFDELRERKKIVVLDDIIIWQFMGPFIKGAKINANDIINLIDHSGAVDGEMGLTEFSAFINLLAKFLESKLVSSHPDGRDNSKHDELDQDQDALMRQYQMVAEAAEDDFGDLITSGGGDHVVEDDEVLESASRYGDFNEDDSDEYFSDDSGEAYDDEISEDDINKMTVGLEQNIARSLVTASTPLSGATKRPSSKYHAMAESSDETASSAVEFMHLLFRRLAGEKGFASVEDCLSWDLIQALLTERQPDGTYAVVSGLSNNTVREAFNTITGSKNKLTNSLELQSLINEVYAHKEKLLKVSAISLANTGTTEESTDVDSGTTAETSDSEQLAAKFSELSGDKPWLSLSQIRRWDLVAELFDAEMLTSDLLLKKFIECGSTKNGKLDLSGFDKLVDYLVVLRSGMLLHNSPDD